LTPTRWVWRLAGFYHLCNSTPRLMEEAKKRFASANRQTLAQWAEQKAKEEAGHDQLALLDIKSMGYQSEAVVEVLVPPAAKSLLDYFTRSVEESDPIECVGYSYTAERLGICIGEGYIQSVEALLPPGIRATRCLRAHSAMSTEVEHVKETVEMIAELTYQERDRVAKACYQTALLRFSPPEEAYISDEEIESILKPLQMTNNHD
jgi:pyrroloquinoline quinone (PQQ) biosynthesis protein C